MIGGKDPDYLRRRAQEERRLADAAIGTPARLAHRQLADLFDREAADADRPVAYVPIPDLIE